MTGFVALFLAERSRFILSPHAAAQEARLIHRTVGLIDMLSYLTSTIFGFRIDETSEQTWLSADEMLQGNSELSSASASPTRRRRRNSLKYDSPVREGIEANTLNLKRLQVCLCRVLFFCYRLFTFTSTMDCGRRLIFTLNFYSKVQFSRGACSSSFKCQASAVPALVFDH